MPRPTKKSVVSDKHYLYSASVQSVDADVDFFERMYRKHRRRRFRDLREDFCGTAALACEWVRRRPENRAWGVDLDRATLEWGRKHNLSVLEDAARRVKLVRENVLAVQRPKVDVIAAQNFSYSVFKQRAELGEYFKGVRRSLRPGGLFIIDAFGGTDAIVEDREKRQIPKSRAFDGTKVPGFVYYWEQASFNPVDHHIVCHISFKLRDGKRLRRAFTYDWRLWTLPELRELMIEAGFKAADVYVEGWDEEEEDTDGIFRRRVRFENQSGWVAYVVGVT